MSLPKRRIYTDQPFSFSLTQEGSPVNWNSVTIQRIYMVSNAQGGAYAGELAHSIDTSDPSVLHAEWDAHSQFYLGEHSVVCKMKMDGIEGSFDAPVVELVPHSSEIDTSEETTTVNVEIISGESEAIEVAVAIIGRGEGGGTGDHAELENLDFGSSGHTGFQAEIEDLEAIRSGAADGAEAVKTVNSQEPDEEGNVDVPVELVVVSDTMATSEGYSYPTLTVDQVKSIYQAIRNNRSVVVVAAVNKRKRFFVMGETEEPMDSCALLSYNGQYIIKYEVLVPISTRIPEVFVEFSGNVPASVLATLAAKLDSPSVAGQAGQVLTWQATGSPKWQNPASPAGVVKYNGAQLLTASQKAQARENIGAYAKPSTGIPASDLASGVIPDISGFVTEEEMSTAITEAVEGTVRYDEEQTLTDPQKAQARENIDAESPSFIAGGSDSAVTVAMDAGKTYKYMNSTGVSSLAFTLNTPSTEDRRHLWTLKFRSGATATNVTWPAGLYYPDGEKPTIEANSICEISIDEDMCVLVQTYKQATT